MNMYTLTVYIIDGPFGDVVLSHDLQLDIECDFIDEIKVVNVGCNNFIVTN